MTQHGGNIYSFAQQLHCAPEEIIDFSSNINPHQAVDITQFDAQLLKPYADPSYQTVKKALKQRYTEFVPFDIELFNGASAAIFALLRFLKPEICVLYAPLYGEYQQVSQFFAEKTCLINRFEEKIIPIPPNSTIIFVNPSTPDGCYYSLEKLIFEWKKASCTIIIDESFLDFTPYTSAIEYLKEYSHFFIIKSLTKFYGCAGVRFGFIVGNSQSINSLRQQEPIWKLSSFDIWYVEHALQNTDFVVETFQKTKELREILKTVLIAQNWHVYDSQANFLLAKLERCDGYDLQNKLLPDKILVRVCDNFDFLDAFYVRFAVKEIEDILCLEKALERISAF